MPKRTDQNQAVIVMALRANGAAVQTLHGVGRGVPDLLVGFQGRNYLFEIKNGSQPSNKRKLTPDEARWHSGWNGQVTTVETIAQALKIIGVTLTGEVN